MISTAAIAENLAAAAAPFEEWLGKVRANDLLALVRAELGHEAILDDFQPHGPDGHRARAVGRSPILHVVSGNTPHAGLQSLLRGLLVGAHNLCKLPASALVPEVAAFRAGLAPPLAARVELSERLPDVWLDRAEAVVVFGSDETILALHRRLRPDQAFIPHGHRVSFAVVLDDPGGASWAEAARAVSLFDQRGCLSPHLLYVRGDARAYAEGLAGEMDRFNRHTPRGALTAGESAALRAWRDDWRFRAANAPDRFALWLSAGSTAWTVFYDAVDSAFAPSLLNRAVHVRPLPADLRAAVAGVRPFLSTVGSWPAGRAELEWLASLDLGASRYCPLGAMQQPPLTWHQDGAPPLAALVRWIDLEAA